MEEPVKYCKVKETCLSCNNVWGKFWCSLTREKPFKCTICRGEIADRKYTLWHWEGKK